MFWEEGPYLCLLSNCGSVPGRVVITTEYFGSVLSAAKTNDAK